MIRYFKKQIIISLFLLILLGGNMSIFSQTSYRGVYQKQLKLKNKDKFLYTVSLPSNYNKQDTFPMVIALHYGWNGELPKFYGKDFLLGFVKPGLEELNAIIVAPDCPGKNWKDTISESAVLELYHFMLNKYNIEKSRVLITGFSLGAEGTWHLLTKYTDLFSVAIILAGTNLSKESINVIKNIPIYIIHGTNDELFSVAQKRNFIDLLHKMKLDIKYMELDGVKHYETYRYIPALRLGVNWVKEKW